MKNKDGLYEKYKGKILGICNYKSKEKGNYYLDYFIDKKNYYIFYMN